MDELDYIPTTSITRGAKRGEIMRHGAVRKYLFGDTRKSDGFIFFAYRSVDGHYLENWRSPESFKKSQAQSTRQAREYRANNLEKVRACARRYSSTHPERLYVNAINWQRNNPERARELVDEWQLRNPEKLRANEAKRRARKRDAMVDLDESQKKIIWTLYDYRRRVSECTGIRHDVDHIHPISRGGKHLPENLRVIPTTINNRKHAKLPHQFQLP